MSRLQGIDMEKINRDICIYTAPPGVEGNDELNGCLCTQCMLPLKREIKFLKHVIKLKDRQIQALKDGRDQLVVRLTEEIVALTDERLERDEDVVGLRGKPTGSSEIPREDIKWDYL